MINRSLLMKELLGIGLDPADEIDQLFLQAVEIIVDRIEIDVQDAIDVAIARHRGRDMIDG